MVKKAGEILTLLFIGLGLGFWVAAMATHGWLIIHQVRYYKFDGSILTEEVSKKE